MESRQVKQSDNNTTFQTRDICEACGDGLDTKRKAAARSYSIATLEALCGIIVHENETNPFASALARARARTGADRNASVAQSLCEVQKRCDVENVVEKVITCGICHREWKQMSYRRTKPTRVASLLQAWRRRRDRYSDTGPKKMDLFCLPCRLGASGTNRAELSRNPTHYHDLLSTLSSPPVVQDMWCSEFTRMTSISMAKSEKVLRAALSARFCSYHHNCARNSKNSAEKCHPALRGAAGRSGLCIFDGRGCAGRLGGHSLRRVPSPSLFTESEAETYLEMDDSIWELTDGVCGIDDVRGARACRPCLSIITRDQAAAGTASVNELAERRHRMLVDIVMLVLSDPCIRSAPTRDYYWKTHPELIRTASANVRTGACGMRVLPMNIVTRDLHRIATIASENGSKRTPFLNHRTVATYINPALATHGIFHRPVSSRQRCYVSNADMDRLAADMCAGAMRGGVVVKLEELAPGPVQLRACLDKLSTHYLQNQQRYWAGHFDLNSEIAEIPNPLWVHVLLLAASGRRRASWEVRACASGRDGSAGTAAKVFPMDNCKSCLPSRGIEFSLAPRPRRSASGAAPLSGQNCKIVLPDSLEHAREDCVLAIRVTKIIEQLVFSRTNSIAGPFTTQLSKAGFLEHSVSWSAVLNKLGLGCSPETVARYRGKLEDERASARFGAFGSDITDLSIPVCPMDNWNINPLHCVKAHGKDSTGINGCLVQGHVRKRTNSALNDDVDDGDSAWRDVHEEYPTREAFAASFTSPAHTEVVNGFSEIAVGLAYFNRNSLVGVEGGADGNSSFKALLLSAFKPHGGLMPDDPRVSEQRVIYVDVTGENAAEALTLRRKVKLIIDCVRPWDPRRPRFIALVGDQPTFKILVEMVLESKRSGTELHKWIVPFPGFFHCEKQCLYPLCKEMLHGLGLSELAAKAGLSGTTVENVLTHSHARNNRAIIFNVSGAMIFRAFDAVVAADASIGDRIRSATSRVGATPLAEAISQTNPLRSRTTSAVSEGVLCVGKIIVDALKRSFHGSANWEHLIRTNLLGCMLPTVGFHVLSRTGHTALIDSMWFSVSSILHASGHLKYQQVFMFYGFIRMSAPISVIRQLLLDEPGLAVLRVPSFTSGKKFGLDQRGHVYVHVDESLEMLFVRHLKALRTSLLENLENASAWLMDFSGARSFCRYLVGANRAHVAGRNQNDVGEGDGVPFIYDRQCVQWKTMSAMLRLMTECDFLGPGHVGSEYLTNMFVHPPAHLADKSAQVKLLDVQKHGQQTTAYHASVLFPDLFGNLSEKDFEEGFGVRQFPAWSKRRRILTAGTVMSAAAGIPTRRGVGRQKKDVGEKLFSKRQAVVSKRKDLLYDKERAASDSGQVAVVKEARHRRDELKRWRHLISPFADAHRDDVRGKAMLHANKSALLADLLLHRTDDVFAVLDDIIPRMCPGENDNIISHMSLGQLRPCFAYMLDVMNVVMFRGADGRDGTRLFDIVVEKMSTVAASSTREARSIHLRQIHLHSDDPTLVIPHKRAEQLRRDEATAPVSLDESYGVEPTLPDVYDELSVPWGHLIGSRREKDVMATLHLFCGAVAVQRQLNANALSGSGAKSVITYLHGGRFVIGHDCIGKPASELCARRGRECHVGAVVLYVKGGSSVHDRVTDSNAIIVPRTVCLVFHSDVRGLQLGATHLRHGEAENRFVASYTCYTESNWAAYRAEVGNDTLVSNCVIASGDTDVLMILLLATHMHGSGLTQIMRSKAIDIDVLIKRLNAVGLSAGSLAATFCMAGCDFIPGTRGVGHRRFLEGAILCSSVFGGLVLSPETEVDMYQTVALFAYLARHGVRRIWTEVEVGELKAQLEAKVARHEIYAAEARKELSGVFCSKFAPASLDWIVDVRNYVHDRANSTSACVTPDIHMHHQVARVKFICWGYWNRSFHENLSPDTVGGRSPEYGYREDATVLYEEPEDVKKIQKRMDELIVSCKCAKSCSTGRCKCRKFLKACIGCDCSTDCKNTPEARTSKDSDQRTVCPHEPGSVSSTFEGCRSEGTTMWTTFDINNYNDDCDDVAGDSEACTITTDEEDAGSDMDVVQMD